MPCGGLARRRLGDARLIQRHEVDRLDHQGRHAAVAHHIRHDAARRRGTACAAPGSAGSPAGWRCRECCAGGTRRHRPASSRNSALPSFLASTRIFSSTSKMSFSMRLAFRSTARSIWGRSVDLRRRAGIFERQVLDVLGHHLKVGAPRGRRSVAVPSLLMTVFLPAWRAFVANLARALPWIAPLRQGKALHKPCSGRLGIGPGLGKSVFKGQTCRILNL